LTNHRSITGTAGRVENAQVVVLLVYAGPAGHAVIDRELYLPRSWARDPERLRAAGVPAQVGFATKPALATRMLVRGLDAGVPARAWQCVSAGTGAKGHRYYDWAFIRLDPSDPARGGQHWLMIRRNHTTGELASYRCWTPRPTPLAVLVTVAGRRWSIEERIQTRRGLCGLDQHQVRRWCSW
jgi:SRSO17 transposase